MNLNKAYGHFWNDSQQFGKPRFKSKKNRRASYSTNNQKGSVRIEGHKVKLPKVGWVKLCQHRPLPENSIISGIQAASCAMFADIRITKPRTYL